MTVEEEIKRATHLQTFKILNRGKPAELNQLMPMNNNGLRMTEHKKLGTKPKWLSKTKLTRSIFRSRAYYFNTLPMDVTKQPTVIKFKKIIEETHDEEQIKPVNQEPGKISPTQKMLSKMLSKM